MTIQRREKSELLPRRRVCEGTAGVLSGVTIPCLFHEERTESLNLAAHTSPEILACHCLVKHFLQRQRAGHIRKVSDKALGTGLLTLPVEDLGLGGVWTQTLTAFSWHHSFPTGYIVSTANRHPCSLGEAGHLTK